MKINVKNKHIQEWGASELGKLLDLYWGGSERRITKLTLKILGINLIALLVFIILINYLGQYHNQIIQARLEMFDREAKLISVSLVESNLLDEQGRIINEENLSRFIRVLDISSGKKLSIYARDGSIEGRFRGSNFLVKNRSFQSLSTLKSMVRFTLSWMPGRNSLPQYYNESEIENVENSLKGTEILAVWQADESNILLTISTPLVERDKIIGSLYMTWDGDDIAEEIVRVSSTLLVIFFVTLCFTILLSIYLSGLIARPLKKLTKAAGNVRNGEARYFDIPDFSARQDEIGELSLVLRSMTQTLHEQMDASERFAADVAHELKNPLTSLKSAVETLGIVKSKKDKEKLMGIIEHDIHRLDRLITDISNFSRLDKEMSDQKFESINLTQLCLKTVRLYDDPLKRSEVCDEASCVINYQNSRIDFLSVDSNIKVWGNEIYLGQVFENILSNALSFVPQNEGEIRIFVAKSRKKAHITIENNGPSIPEGKLETIFDRFYSHRPVYEDYGQNSGLGLSICKQIIQAHGGEIYAENLVGQEGVRFTIILSAQ